MLEILQTYDKLHEPLGQTSLEPFQVICSVSRAADATSALFDCKIYYASVKDAFVLCVSSTRCTCLYEWKLLCLWKLCCLDLDGSQRKTKEKL